jgi:signal transduction histidine kinase
MNRQTRLLYGVLFIVWVLIVVWQFVEHNRVKRAAQIALINRSKDISNTLGLVMRSQRRWGIISKEHLESALQSLVKLGEMSSIALLNDEGDVVASAGEPIDFRTKAMAPSGQPYWTERNVILLNLVDLGAHVPSEPDASRPTLVLERNELPNPFSTNRTGTNRASFPSRPPSREGRPGDGHPPRPGEESVLEADSDLVADERPPPRVRGWPFRRPPGDGRPPRPFWMSEEEYQEALNKKGVHSFVIVLSTQTMHSMTGYDLWLRLIISGLALLSVVGLAMAWRNLVKSSELEVRLVRAAELNTRLKEMNFAAAGLAHETKNPLNIIRGLAQIISKQNDASTQIRQKTSGIIDEADRVTAQLNEFINFSRPRQLRRTQVPLTSAVAEVTRALGHDLEEKNIQLRVQDDLPTIEADEQQLRQALFNLLINAIQAAHEGGEIQVAALKLSNSNAALEIRDNGPGIPAEHRIDVFKPYFTTNQKGTGLGLAVVQQIVLAHGWEIECLPNEPRGAIFRISHLRLAAHAAKERKERENP